MTKKRYWGRLDLREKMSLCLSQVEWALFQAQLTGLEVDVRSIHAMIETRRSLVGGNVTEQLDKAVTGAHDAYKSSGGWNEKYGHPKTLSRCSLACMCWSIAWNVHSELDLDLDSVSEFYLEPIGDLKEKSPLARRLRNGTILQ